MVSIVFYKDGVMLNRTNLYGMLSDHVCKARCYREGRDAIFKYRDNIFVQTVSPGRPLWC